MPLTHWAEDMSTGVATLDELHRELIESMSEAASASDEDFANHYSALVKNIKCALIKEEQWMERIDSTLLKMYREQHSEVLSALDHIHRRVLEKDFVLGRRVVAELLPQWYAVHASTLDMVLAIAIQVNGIQINAASQPPGIYLD